MYKSKKSLIKRTFLVVVPAVVVVLASLHLLLNKVEPVVAGKPLLGEPLAAYDNLYPIKVDKQGHLSLDKDKFMDGVRFFIANKNPKASSDLVYLGQSNDVAMLLDQKEKNEYANLLAMYGSNQDQDKQREQVFQVYKNIVNGIGQTFAGTDIEIVLHDTRNPLRSVVALQNPISGRRLGDTTTNFGIELIKNYSTINRQGSNHVSYAMTLKDGRHIKSTTIPLFDSTFGLIGFICLNIDLSKLDIEKNREAVSSFLESFKATNEDASIAEIIENSKKNLK